MIILVPAVILEMSKNLIPFLQRTKTSRNLFLKLRVSLFSALAVMIKNSAGDFIVTFGPNPIQRSEQLQFSYYAEVGGTMDVNIYSLTGKQVLKENRRTSNGLNTLRLNVTNLAAGQYAAEFILNGKNELRKIIIQ